MRERLLFQPAHAATIGIVAVSVGETLVDIDVGFVHFALLLGEHPQCVLTDTLLAVSSPLLSSSPSFAMMPTPFLLRFSLHFFFIRNETA